MAAIEDAVLWVSFVTGILGALSFIWQVYLHFTGRTAESNRTLNRNVLRPWSEVKIDHRYNLEHANLIAFVIPKEALPSGVAADQGLDLERLPGLAKGMSFLRRQYPLVHSQWDSIASLRKKYDSLLKRRRAILEPKIRTGMVDLSLTLMPAPSWKEFAVNTYILAHVTHDVESSGYWAAQDGDPRLNVHATRTQSNGVIYLEYRASSNPWLMVAEQNDVDATALNKLAMSWIADPEVRKVNKGLFDCAEKLEKAIDKFRIDLKEVAVNIDLMGE